MATALRDKPAILGADQLACSGDGEKPAARPWYSLSREISAAVPSAISAAASNGSINPRLPVVSDMMMTDVNGARTTPVK